MKNTALLLLLFGFSVCLNAACKTTTEALKSATTTTQQAASVFSLPPSQNPSADVMAAIDKLKACPSYRIESNNGEGTQKGLADYLAPDRRHLYAATGESAELIVIGKNWYSKEQGKPWKKSELPFDTKDANEFIELLKPRQKPVRYLRAEVTDGIATRVYEYEQGALLSDKTIGKKMIWIRVSDGLPHKLDQVTRIEATEIRMVSQFSYHHKLTIEPPI